VALKTRFGRRADSDASVGGADRDGTGPDRNADGIDDRLQPGPPGATAVDRDGDGVDDRTGTPAAKVRSGRTSFFATLSLIFGVCAVLASLSGRLAPLGLAVGILGLLLSAAGTAASGRPRVTGKGVALLGLLTSLTGVLFAIFAMNHTAAWLDSDIDQVSRLRDWLDTQLPWLQNW